jgi:hypothetical protein
LGDVLIGPKVWSCHLIHSGIPPRLAVAGEVV